MAPSSLSQPLPADLFHLIFTELASHPNNENQQTYATLHNCVVSSKHLASAGAIAALYRICHECPVKSGGSEFLSMAEQDLNVMKWSILWRTIILSALGKTSYPYCRHLRELDLRDLGDLLDRLQDNNMKSSKVAKHFWSGELAPFHHIEVTKGKHRRERLDTKKILMAVGDVLTEQAPLLEGISEPSSSDILSSALPKWASRLSHLRELEFWDGKALAEETLRNLLHVNCKSLSELRFHHSTGAESDAHIAALINGLPENTLTRFENISLCGIAAETLLALNNHGKSLTSLKLALSGDGILALKYLQGCTRLHTLSITSLQPSGVDLKATENDVFLEIVEWLRACDFLDDVYFDSVLSAPDLCLPILLNKNVKLRELQILAREELYPVQNHHDFHRALSQQQSLKSLWLRANADEVSGDDNEILVDALCSLTGLEELNLLRISEFFTEQHVKQLAEQLPSLVHFTVATHSLSDAIWASLASLRQVKVLTFAGITKFTADGLMGFIEQLGPGNAELGITVDNADFEGVISDDAQDQIRDAIAAKVGGRFEYQPMRDPNAIEFGDSDSD